MKIKELLVILYFSSSVCWAQSETDKLAPSIKSLAVTEKNQIPSSIFTESLDWAKDKLSIPSKNMKSADDRVNFLQLVYYEATRANLDPDLVLSLIQVESNFKQYAVSSVGAMGYMQIMPFWVKALMGTKDRLSLFDMHTNLRYGCTILSHYLELENGNWFRALGRYNGSLGKDNYPKAVLAAYKQQSKKTLERQQSISDIPALMTVSFDGNQM
jgi:soluble lytic murein transglycosylase-like protein